MQNSISISMSQSFEMERINRAIDETADPAQLQTIAKQLLQACLLYTSPSPRDPE